MVTSNFHHLDGRDRFKSAMDRGERFTFCLLLDLQERSQRLDGIADLVRREDRRMGAAFWRLTRAEQDLLRRFVAAAITAGRVSLGGHRFVPSSQLRSVPNAGRHGCR